MKERPILFNGPMVRALLDGSKTQTRRIVKGQTPEWAHVTDEEYADGQEFFMVCGTKQPDGLRPILDGVTCPFGQFGDRLWVREGWKAHTTFDHLSPCHIPESHVWYLADDGYKAESRGRASMHMPRWASRILLEVVSVRVERLQDISEVDALAEGISSLRTREWDQEHFPTWRKAFDEACVRGEKPPVGPLPSESYRALWESINGAGSWDANPWVWVVEFKRVAP
jgi:hypothetical protein